MKIKFGFPAPPPPPQLSPPKKKTHPEATKLTFPYLFHPQ